MLEDNEEVSDPQVQSDVHDELQDLQHLGLGGQHCRVCVLLLLGLLLFGVGGMELGEGSGMECGRQECNGMWEEGV